MIVFLYIHIHRPYPYTSTYAPHYSKTKTITFSRKCVHFYRVLNSESIKKDPIQGHTSLYEVSCRYEFEDYSSFRNCSQSYSYKSTPAISCTLALSGASALLSMGL